MTDGIINYRGQRMTHRSTHRYTVRNTLAGSKHQRFITLVYGGKKQYTRRRGGVKTRRGGKRERTKWWGRTKRGRGR